MSVVAAAPSYWFVGSSDLIELDASSCNKMGLFLLSLTAANTNNYTHTGSWTHFF